MYPFKINIKRAISKKQKNDRCGRLWACHACTLKRCVIHVNLLSSHGIGPSRPSARISPPICLVSRDLWRGGSAPLSARFWSHDRAARWRNRSSLSLTHPPTPRSACAWGGKDLRGSRHTYWLGRHLFEGGFGTRGSSPLKHRNYIHRD